MGFQVSPGVEVKEIDLTNVIPAVSTSIGGYAGRFRWGPINEIRLIGSESGLVNVFGKPNTQYARPFFTAASFLNYGDALKAVRAEETDLLNSNSAGAGTLIKNEDHFDNLTLTEGVYSRYAGLIGNKTKVYILNSVNFAGYDSALSDQFDIAPDADTEVHIVITTSAKEFTGDNSEETEQVVEKWAFLGVDAEAKTEDGANNYYVDVINKSSNWVYIPVAITDAATAVDEATSTHTLANGADGSTTRDNGMITTALDLLSDSEIEDVNLLFTEDDTGNVATLGNYVLGIATSRKDCVAFVSPQIADTVNNTTPLVSVKAYKNLLSAPDSYGVIGSGAAYVYNRYTDKYLWIGTQGHLAGLCANTDDVAEPWFSPAGFNRGNLRGVAKLSYNPKKIDRDELYKAGINPIVTMPGEGTLLYGDKTLQSKPSAFDRINVRRLFIVLEKAIATAAKYQLFELNDEFTRATFRNAVEPFLRDVRGRRGVTDFMVVCDETNNTGEVIDTNRFVADIYIKPARSINFITLNFIATRTGVDFSEVAGLSNA